MGLYISMKIDDSPLAVHFLAMCLADMEAWLKARGMPFTFSFMRFSYLLG